MTLFRSHHVVFLVLLMLLTFKPVQSQTRRSTASPPVLRAGEIRVDGRVSSVDAKQGTFLLAVSSFTTPPGRSKMTLPVKAKQVSVSSSTRFLHATNQQQPVSMATLSMATLKPGMAVAVSSMSLSLIRPLHQAFREAAS